MGSTDMEDKLRQLECLFTWGVKQSDIADLNSILQKLHDRIRFCPLKYHATYYNLLAFISHLEGKTDTALDYLQKAESALKEDQRKETEYLVTFSSFAWIHYYLQRINDAEEYLNKVNGICKDIPGSSVYSCSLPIIHGEKAWSFLRLGRTFYEQAKESFSKALKEEPDNELFNVGYAIVLYRLHGMTQAEDPGKVIAQLRKALSLEPANSEIMVLLALKLQGSKRQEAQNLIKEALRLSPDVPQVTSYVAKYFRTEGNIEESLSVLKRAVELAPNSSFLHHQIGLCHKQQLIQMFEEKKHGSRISAAQKAAKVSECIQYFSKAVELKPNNIYAKVNLADAFGESRQLGEAEIIFCELIDDNTLSESEKQHCHTSYGLFLLYKKKDEDKAVSQFKLAFRIPVDTYERKQAGKKLKMIAERNLNNKKKVKEALEILALISSEKGQETQAKKYQQRAQQHSSHTDELTQDFAKRLEF
ncbi:interferon-induced protein with tetratricopeptide repeats 9 [Danio rerio]|uniref:Interferon-induced protein with tetratricopeptide repeats n=1 Tax=Danio rerio TaxID=7955 RepID=A0A068FNU8_DANRE|nr:interferon-induced protein with tetratricopeptide repeats 9 [Danio rerio]AID69088.1 interferon-induced protein with tetratricopeptide repeats [Danio rerio]|eukprot:NP_001315640.1 interferon-induced protein with tetratricopeptide repeats 9 [Danio rerio]